MQAPRPRRTRVLAVGAAVVALTVSACTGTATDGSSDTGPAGQLTVLSLGPVATWDPQRISTPQDIAFAGRVFLRTLTAYPAGPDAARQRSVEGDLATTAGSVDTTLKRWSFTLRDGVTWQDGSPVTCEDVRYGVSRSFAEPFASQGLNFPLAYLDIPRKADGSSVYAGPFAKDTAGQAAFDKAVTCDGTTVTFRLSTPMADFNQVVALPVLAPFKQSQEKAADGTYTVFSNGPYQLEDAWNPSAGGRFERNPRWDKASDP